MFTINCPIYGFISLPKGILSQVLSHRYFQRLRHIQQLGLAAFVYPGAVHTRFHHALGAMHLMQISLETLQKKGIEVSPEEKEAAMLAILLHDVGHSPFSHVLEHKILDCAHEEITLLMMKSLNLEFSGALSLAMLMFEGKYARTFFHSLISSQLDVDRMDYLQRDSFYCGVLEGMIGAKRMIQTLEVRENTLGIAPKGIQSIEAFILARKFMYEQVYLHKTCLVAQHILLGILGRIKEIHAFDCIDEQLRPFFEQAYRIETLPLDDFAQLDDHNIWLMLKKAANHPDIILSNLCKRLLERKFFGIYLSNYPFPPEHPASIRQNLNLQAFIAEKTADIQKNSGIEAQNLHYYLAQGSLERDSYSLQDEIKVIQQDIQPLSHFLPLERLNQPCKIDYFIYPKP